MHRYDTIDVHIITALLVKIITDQRKYYHVEIHVSPAKESHEIGSQVTLNCTATPSPQKFGNFTLPWTYYRWYSTGRGRLPFAFDNSVTITIVTYKHSVEEYFCLIYRYSNGPVLGTGRTTIIAEGNNSNVDCM